MRTYRGTEERDVFHGRDVADRAFGNGGNDDLFGNGGDDELHGGAGNDLLVGGAGKDQLYGGLDSDLLDGGVGDDLLNGGAGFDYTTYFYSEAGVNVNLGRGVASDGMGGTDSLKSIEGVYGSQFDDVIRGNGATNELFGNDGDDVLIGGGGQDLTVGGAGADRFVFDDGDVSTGRVHADLIGDFSHAEGDTIDLSRIDADVNTDGDQAFTFIGMGAFTHQAGELQAVQGQNGWTVSGDVNGDGVADFQVLVTVTDGHQITAADFVL